MKEVLPDTNIILWTFSGGIDFREAIAAAAPNFDIKIPTCVIDELKKLDWVQLPEIDENVLHAYQSFSFLFREAAGNLLEVEKINKKRNSLMEKLQEKGISTRPATHAVHMLQYYKEKYKPSAKY